MSLVKSLKTFFQKELQEKRFLEEALKYVDELEQLEQISTDLRNGNIRLASERDKITGEVEDLKTQYKDLEVSILTTRKEIEEELEEARKAKDELIADGVRVKNDVIEDANAQVTVIKSKIVEATATLEGLGKEIGVVRGQLDGFYAERERLKSILTPREGE